MLLLLLLCAAFPVLCAAALCCFCGYFLGRRPLNPTLAAFRKCQELFFVSRKTFCIPKNHFGLLYHPKRLLHPKKSASLATHQGFGFVLADVGLVRTPTDPSGLDSTPRIHTPAVRRIRDECSQVSASTSCWSMQVRQAPTNASDTQFFRRSGHVLSWLDWSELRQIRMACKHLPQGHTSAAALAGMSAMGCHICTNSSAPGTHLFHPRRQGCNQRSKDGTSFLQAFRCSRAVAHERRRTMLAGDGILSHVHRRRNCLLGKRHSRGASRGNDASDLRG